MWEFFYQITGKDYSCNKQNIKIFYKGGGGMGVSSVFTLVIVLSVEFV